MIAAVIGLTAMLAAVVTAYQNAALPRADDRHPPAGTTEENLPSPSAWWARRRGDPDA